MDLQGIDIQALAIAPPQYFHWLDDETGPRVNAMQNDAIFEMTQQAPERFVGIANLPMDHPEAAVNEMRRVKSDLGFNGFEVNADVKGGDLDDRRFDPIWAVAEELEMLAILHPHGWTEPQRMDDYYLINVVCMPLASTVAVSRMILGGVWERFPDLRMLVVHGGGYLPFYFARTDHAYKVQARGETLHLPATERVPAQALLRHHGVLHDAVEYLVGEFGADHVLMGPTIPSTWALPIPSDSSPMPISASTIVPWSSAGNGARLLRIPAR